MSNRYVAEKAFRPGMVGQARVSGAASSPASGGVSIREYESTYNGTEFFIIDISSINVGDGPYIAYRGSI